MRILVTGGAGYLGSVLSRKLLAKGYQVRLIDALWYGKESIEDLRSNKNFELIEDDIRNLVVTVKALKDVDAVIHLASIVGMPASSIEPKSSEEINYLATKNIAELCQLHNINTYIFASTCSVYGSQPETLITEKSPTDPLDFYAKQKYLSERATGWLNKAPTILRFGTLFGLSPRMRFDLVINRFIAQAIKESARINNLGIRWGGAWNIEDIRFWNGSMEKAMNYYIDSRRSVRPEPTRPATPNTSPLWRLKDAFFSPFVPCSCSTLITTSPKVCEVR